MTAQYHTCNYSVSADLTVSLASLASSASYVGRQSTLVDNTSTGYSVIHVQARVTTGVNALAGNIVFYAIRGNGTQRTDGAGASDAAWTPNTAKILDVVVVPTNTTNGTYTLTFRMHDPGPEWGIGVGHNTNANLCVTAGSFQLSWQGERGKSE